VGAACTLLVSPFHVVAGVAQSSLWRILFVVVTIKRPAPASRWHPVPLMFFVRGAMLFAFRQLTSLSCGKQFSVSINWGSYQQRLNKLLQHGLFRWVNACSCTLCYLQAHLCSEVFTRGCCLNTILDVALKRRTSARSIQGFLSSPQVQQLIGWFYCSQLTVISMLSRSFMNAGLKGYMPTWGQCLLLKKAVNALSIEHC
jgi:hypothetical protein